MKNKLEYWKGTGYRCPCECTTFYVDTETHIDPADSIFTGTRHKRVVFICTKCGNRYYPEDVAK